MKNNREKTFKFSLRQRTYLTRNSWFAGFLRYGNISQHVSGWYDRSRQGYLQLQLQKTKKLKGLFPSMRVLLNTARKGTSTVTLILIPTPTLNLILTQPQPKPCSFHNSFLCVLLQCLWRQFLAVPALFVSLKSIAVFSRAALIIFPKQNLSLFLQIFANLRVFTLLSAFVRCTQQKA